MSEGADLISIRPMSKQMQSKIKRHNLFGTKARDVEIRQLMSDIWEQIPAEGRSGLDYVTRELFLHDTELPLKGKTPPDPGFPMDESHPYRIAVNGPSNLLLDFYQNDIPVNVRLNYKDRPATSIEISSVSGKSIPIMIESGDCLVEITSVEPVTVNARAIGNDAPVVDALIRDGGSDPQRKTMYFLLNPESEECITYRLPGTSNQDQAPFRINVRVPMPIAEKDASIDFTLDYAFYDISSRIISKGSLSGIAKKSLYAIYLPDYEPMPFIPSLPEQFFIKAPADAVSVGLTSATAIDVACFSRPEMNLAREIAVGATEPSLEGGLEFYAVAVDREWFYFKPENANQLADTGRTRVVVLPIGIQESNGTKKTETLPDVETLHPNGDLESRIIYDQADPQSVVPADYPLVSILEPGNDYALSIDSKISPYQTYTVKYLLSGLRPSSIKVFVDGKTLISLKPASVRGVMQLPPFASGKHRLKIESGDTGDRFYFSVIEGIVMDLPLYHLRTVYRLDARNDITIEFSKKTWAAEGLNMVFYRSPEETEPLSLEMEALNLPEIEVSKVFRGLTVPIRKYLTSAAPALTGSVLLENNKRFATPQRIFFPLHDDVPPGRYKLAVRTTSADPIYVRFFKLNQKAG
jgi:hypothetical protein